MALNPRENINGVTPQDLNKINNNFMSVWKTLFGGLDFSDTNKELKKKIQTQQLPVQGEGNFDKNYPLYIRFFVPSNTKSITKTSFNMICERYRMDSSVTSGGGKVIDAPIQMSLASANTAISSVSNASGSGSTTSSVNSWYTFDGTGSRESLNPPTVPAFISAKRLDGTSKYNDYIQGTTANSNLLGVITRKMNTETLGDVDFIDLCYLNHDHYVKISIEPHSHNITLEPHTHSANANITIPEHTHSLNEGIKVSSKDALDVRVELNGKQIALMSSNNKPIINDVDCTDSILIGQWNTIKCTTSNLARITIYGIIELVMNY